VLRRLFALYSAAPYRVRGAIGRCARILGLLLRSANVVRVGNHKMVLDLSDNASLRYAADRDIYESFEKAVFVDAIRDSPGCVVLDVGANYGAYTLAACEQSLITGTSRILALEPDRRPFNALATSLALNGYNEVCDLFQVIADDADGEELLSVNARSSADNRTHLAARLELRGRSKVRVREQYIVKSTSVDSLFRTHDVPTDKPLIVKIDIQGNELRALRGMEGVLSSVPAWMIAFEFGPFLVESVGLNTEDFIGWIAASEFDDACQVSPGRVIKLSGRSGLISALRTVDFHADVNFIAAHRMSIPSPRHAFGSTDRVG
jgi:FkbM family methyltransferase